MKCVISLSPLHHGDGYAYGGDVLLTFPLEALTINFGATGAAGKDSANFMLATRIMVALNSELETMELLDAKDKVIYAHEEVAQKYRALMQIAMEQFQLYADEAVKDGKLTKAATNNKYAAMLREAISPSPKEDGNNG